MTCGEGAFRHLDKVFRRYLNKLNRFTIAGKPSRARTSLAKSEIPCKFGRSLVREARRNEAKRETYESCRMSQYFWRVTPRGGRPGRTSGQAVELSDDAIECPESPAPLVVVMKTIKHKEDHANDQHKHHPTPPSAPGDAGENLSRLPRCGRHGQMASTERIHGQGSSPGRRSRRNLPDVVHEFQHGQEPLVRRKIRRTDTARTHSLYGQIRRPEPARRNANDDHAGKSFLRNRVEHHPGRRACSHPRRGLFSWLAGIADALGETRRG